MGQQWFVTWLNKCLHWTSLSGLSVRADFVCWSFPGSASASRLTVLGTQPSMGGQVATGTARIMSQTGGAVISGARLPTSQARVTYGKKTKPCIPNRLRSSRRWNNFEDERKLRRGGVCFQAQLPLWWLKALVFLKRRCWTRPSAWAPGCRRRWPAPPGWRSPRPGWRRCRCSPWSCPATRPSWPGAPPWKRASPLCSSPPASAPCPRNPTPSRERYGRF